MSNQTQMPQKKDHRIQAWYKSFKPMTQSNVNSAKNIWKHCLQTLEKCVEANVCCHREILPGTPVNKPRAYKWEKPFFKQKFGHWGK